MTATITCTRCKTETTAMLRAPLPPPQGDEILANTCDGCFKDWMATEIMIINEYRLDLAVPRNQELLDLEMARFLSLPSSDGGAAAGAPPQARPTIPHAHDDKKGCC